MEGSGESTLRAKYLDWCSARLAERFLDLSPEEIYALARPETSDRVGASDVSEPSEPGAGRSEAAGSPAPSGAAPTRESSAAPSSPLSPAGPAGPQLPRPTDEGYRALVQRVTEALLKRTSLPTFEQWAEAYAETPERFEAELLGFWKDAVEEPGSDTD
ncbi:MAG: hypothetical protein ACN0LA_03750 [Candidatus Longimicrobiales bacterium M2_2A_002]